MRKDFSSGLEIVARQLSPVAFMDSLQTLPLLPPDIRHGLSTKRASAQGIARSKVQRWPRFLYFFATTFGACLWLYAFLGKGFAYAGWPPLYVGEILLVLALMALLTSGRVVHLVRSPIGLTIICFFTWQLVCTVPYLERFGIAVLRDSVLWSYGLFAWAVAAMVLRLPGFVSVAVVAKYSRFAQTYMTLGAALWLATLFLQDQLPHWAGTNVSIPQIKGAEYCVHLAGIMAFSFAGLGQRRPWLPLLAVDLMLGVSARGGLLAFVSAATFVLFLRPHVRRIVPLAAAMLLVIIAMATFEVRTRIPGTTREVSVGQLFESIESIVESSQRQDLQGTKDWRLSWWKKIYDYTVDGPYFWAGKGYGINLANSDGFQVGSDQDVLRSPHNSHLTFLARSGVPGFTGWVVLQALWFVTLFRSYRHAKRTGAKSWASLFLWIMAYWIAFSVSASFDVFLEGPMAGIPFWSLFGLGWGSTLLYQNVANWAVSAAWTPEMN